MRYNARAKAVDENKFGYVVFDGSAHEYHYWLFRYRLKTSTVPAMPTGDAATAEAMRVVMEKRKIAFVVG